MTIPMHPEMRAAVDACAAATTTEEATIAIGRVMDEVAKDREDCTCDGALTDAEVLGFGVYVSDRNVTHHPTCARVTAEPHRFERTPELAELPWWRRLEWWARQPKSPEYDALPLGERLRRAKGVVFHGRL